MAISVTQAPSGGSHQCQIGSASNKALPAGANRATTTNSHGRRRINCQACVSQFQPSRGASARAQTRMSTVPLESQHG